MSNSRDGLPKSKIPIKYSNNEKNHTSNKPVYNAIPPSSLVLLSELTRTAPGSKVRFLGCVDFYDHTNATIILRDRYPSAGRHGPAKSAGKSLPLRVVKTVGDEDESRTAIHLDVTLVLPPITPRALFEVGAWVCVTGYVAYPETRSTAIELEAKSTKQGGNGSAVRVQALLLSSAGQGRESGGSQNERYVRALEARRKAMRSLAKVRKTFAG